MFCVFPDSLLFRLQAGPSPSVFFPAPGSERAGGWRTGLTCSSPPGIPSWVRSPISPNVPSAVPVTCLIWSRAVPNMVMSAGNSLSLALAPHVRVFVRHTPREARPIFHTFFFSAQGCQRGNAPIPTNADVLGGGSQKGCAGSEHCHRMPCVAAHNCRRSIRLGTCLQ